MDLGSSANAFTKLFSTGMVGNIIKNPIFISAIITVITMVLIFLFYSDESKVKTALYILTTTTMLVFLHNKLILDDYNTNKIPDDTRKLFNSIDSNNSISGGREILKAEDLEMLHI